MSTPVPGSSTRLDPATGDDYLRLDCFALSWVRSTDYEEMVAVVSQSAEMSTVAVSSHSE